MNRNCVDYRLYDRVLKKRGRSSKSASLRVSLMIQDASSCASHSIISEIKFNYIDFFNRGVLHV